MTKKFHNDKHYFMQEWILACCNFILLEEMVGKCGVGIWNVLQCFLWVTLINSMFKTCSFYSYMHHYIYKDFHLAKSDY